MTEFEINQQVAKEICDQGSFKGELYPLGSCVALLDGNVVAVAADIGPALRALRTLDANPRRGLIFGVGPHVVDIIRSTSELRSCP